MRLIDMRMIINLFATLIGIIAVILVFFLPNYSILIFSVEVIILPTIYIIGNAYVEEKIKTEYQNIISSITEDSEGVKQKYQEAVILNRELTIRLKRGKNGY